MAKVFLEFICKIEKKQDQYGKRMYLICCIVMHADSIDKSPDKA